ncbi:hypothetical protein ACX4MT_18865 [Roseomonas mucosa]
MDKFHENLEASVAKMPGRVGHCLVNAFRHIHMASQIFEVDQEMAALRSITAEEEAATALFISLKNKKYHGASLLEHRNHLHKNAVGIFLYAVRQVISKSNSVKNFQLSLNSKLEIPRIDLSFKISELGVVADADLYIQPDNPLNFSMRHIMANGATSNVDFVKQMSGILSALDEDDIIRKLKEVANYRNHLLYATDNALPNEKIERQFIDEKLNMVRAISILSIITNQTAQKQLFISQCLSAFLKILKKADEKIEGLAVDLPVRKFSGLSIIVNRLGDAPSEVIVSRRYIFDLQIGYELLQVFLVDVKEIRCQFLKR